MSFTHQSFAHPLSASHSSVRPSHIGHLHATHQHASDVHIRCPHTTRLYHTDLHISCPHASGLDIKCLHAHHPPHLSVHVSIATHLSFAHLLSACPPSAHPSFARPSFTHHSTAHPLSAHLLFTHLSSMCPSLTRQLSAQRLLLFTHFRSFHGASTIILSMVMTKTEPCSCCNLFLLHWFRLWAQGIVKVNLLSHSHHILWTDTSAYSHTFFHHTHTTQH